jgi:hypothetical protein
LTANGKSFNYAPKRTQNFAWSGNELRESILKFILVIKQQLQSGQINGNGADDDVCRCKTLGSRGTPLPNKIFAKSEKNRFWMWKSNKPSSTQQHVPQKHQQHTQRAEAYRGCQR